MTPIARAFGIYAGALAALAFLADLAYRHFGSTGSTWVVILAFVAWVWSAIAISPYDHSGTAFWLARISRSLLIALAVAAVLAALFGRFLPAVTGGIYF